MIKFSVTNLATSFRRRFSCLTTPHHLYDLASSSAYDLGCGRCIWYRWWYQEHGPVFRGPLILSMMRTFLKVLTLGFQMKPKYFVICLNDVFCLVVDIYCRKFKMWYPLFHTESMSYRPSNSHRQYTVVEEKEIDKKKQYLITAGL